MDRRRPRAGGRGAGVAVIWPALPALASIAYYLLVLAAAIKWQRRTPAKAGQLPPISILKPIRGRDPHFYEAIRSHAAQKYPRFEILFGTSDPSDTALGDIERLRSEFPGIAIETVIVSTKAPNAKAGVLAELAKRARYPLLLVNDSDIVVEPGYLQTVAQTLERPGAGLVTCIYRARAESPASRMEALGIATEFAPSVMVARLLGQAEFALGSTMLLSAETLRAAGGFEAISEYLADDYQLGKRVSGLGLKIEFAPFVVATDLGAAGWPQTWLHQVRWARTIRVSRPGGYYGYAVTHATPWALLAFAAGESRIGVAAIAVRMAAGLISALTLRDTASAVRFWLIPLRDLFGFATWMAGLFGSSIQWRDRRLRLRRDGRIHYD